MTANFLKLNDDKTEIVVISRKKDFSSDISSIRMGDSDIAPSETVKNLGVFVNASLSMESHINTICKKAFYEVRNIGRPLLNDKAAATLVHAFVTSKIDYCNSLLYGVPKNS